MMKGTGLQRSLILAALFLLVADGDDMLRAEYRMDE